MTRHNLSPNPAAKNDVTGWSGGASPSRVTGLSSTVRTTGAQWTSGTFQTTPFGAASPGVEYTVSVYVLTASFDQSNRDLYVNFSRSAGGDTQPSSVKVSLTAGTWSRVSITATSPALTTGVGVLLDGINAGVSAVTMTGMLAEAAGAVDTYFDGDTASASWDGTDGNSASTLNDAQSIAPNSLTVPVVLGSPAVSQSLSVAPSSLTVPVALGAPALSQSLTIAPSSLVVPVALGSPSAAMVQPGFAISPDTLVVPVILGEPSLSFTTGPGSWTQLSSIAREARADHERNQQRIANPIDCPEHGWPLERTSRGLHCTFGGHVVR